MAHTHLLFATVLVLGAGCTTGRGVTTADGSPEDVNPAGCPEQKPDAQGVCALPSTTRCSYSPDGEGCDKPAWSCSCAAGHWSCLEGRKPCPEDGGPTCPATVPENHSFCSLPSTARCDYLYSRSRCNYLDLYWHCACDDGRWSCSHDWEDCFRVDAGPAVPCPVAQPQGGTFCQLDEITTCVYYVGDGPEQVWYCDCRQSHWSCYEVTFGDAGV